MPKYQLIVYGYDIEGDFKFDVTREDKSLEFTMQRIRVLKDNDLQGLQSAYIEINKIIENDFDTIFSNRVIL